MELAAETIYRYTEHEVEKQETPQNDNKLPYWYHKIKTHCQVKGPLEI